MREFIFLHDRSFTQFTALVEAYDLRQARRILNRNYPKPNGWTLAVERNGRYSKIYKYRGDDVFWENPEFNFQLLRRKKYKVRKDE